jgi:hypothetical protein
MSYVSVRQLSLCNYLHKLGNRRQLLQARPTSTREPHEGGERGWQRQGHQPTHAARLRPQLLLHGVVCGRARCVCGEAPGRVVSLEALVEKRHLLIAIEAVRRQRESFSMEEVVCNDDLWRNQVQGKTI